MAAMSLLLGTLCVSSTIAQPPGDPQDGPPPGGGFPGGPRGRRPGPPPMGGPRRNTVADTPVGALEVGLKLSGDQKTKIARIQRQYRRQQRQSMPRPGDPFQAPDPQAMQDAMRRRQALNTQAIQSIEAVLTAPQKQALPNFLKELDNYRMLGIPPEVLGDLQITADQKKSLFSIADSAKAAMRKSQEDALQDGDPASHQQNMQRIMQHNHRQAMAVLTEDQQGTIEDFMDAHMGFPPNGGGGPPFGRGGPGNGNGPRFGPGGPPDGNQPGGPPDGNGPPFGPGGPPDGSGPGVPPDGNGTPPPTPPDGA